MMTPAPALRPEPLSRQGLDGTPAMGTEAVAAFDRADRVLAPETAPAAAMTPPAVAHNRARRGALCVVLHDVAPATQAACDRVFAAVRDVAGDVPLTLLAVPRYHGRAATPAFEQWVSDRAARGDEIALHGYTHLDDGLPRDWIDRLRRRHYTRGEGEFCDLAPAEVMRRLVTGKRWFERNRWRLRGFVAPAWLMGEATWRALPEFPLDYTCTLGGVYLLPDLRCMHSQALVYSCSTVWRRQLSLGWNRALAATLRSKPLLRLELHPHDVDHPSIRRSWQHLLERHLDDRLAMTLGDWADGWRASPHAAVAPGAAAGSDAG